MDKDKNVYRVVIFANEQRLGMMEYCADVQRAASWCSNSARYRGWTALNVYWRSSGLLVGQFRRGEFIPRYPK